MMQAMQKMLFSVLLQLFLSKPVQDLLAKWKAEILAFIEAQAMKILEAIKAELMTWVPIFIKAIITGIAQSAGQFVVNAENKMTDIIPGQLDDKILDPMVTNALDKLGELTGLNFR